jgi:hypothetical protein
MKAYEVQAYDVRWHDRSQGHASDSGGLRLVVRPMAGDADFFGDAEDLPDDTPRGVCQSLDGNVVAILKMGEVIFVGAGLELLKDDPK